jgi:hypothetical protein
LKIEDAQRFQHLQQQTASPLRVPRTSPRHPQRRCGLLLQVLETLSILNLQLVTCAAVQDKLAQVTS